MNPLQSKALIGFSVCTHTRTTWIQNHCGLFPVVASAVLEHAINNVGLDAHATFCTNAGRSLSLGKEVELHAIPSAHEEHAISSKGEHHFLGYVLKLGGICIYHSGDCIPYEGLEEHLGDLKPDIALLPVNGRDAYRANHNVPGNFHYEEAARICQRTGVTYMIPHHFGMFEFNTVDPAELHQKIRGANSTFRVVLPKLNQALVFSLPES